MKTLYYFLIPLLCLAFVGCRPEASVEADSPARTIREAQARLAQKEWIYDKIYIDKALVYVRGADKEVDESIGIDWYKFHLDGTFEIKYTDIPETEKSIYVVNESKNTITFMWDHDDPYPLECTIEAGSVYNNSFTMSYTEEYDDKTEAWTISMVTKP